MTADGTDRVSAAPEKRPPGHERFNLRNLYLYVVCLIALVIAIFALVNLVRAGVELLYPDPGSIWSVPLDTKTGPAEYQQLLQAARDSSRRQSVLSLVTAATTLAVAFPVYLCHWRRVQKERQQQLSSR